MERTPTMDGFPQPKRLYAFLAIAIAMTMAVLDGAIVNVALPTIGRELAVSPMQTVWIVNAFQLAVTISLLPLASLGDSIGYKKVYWCGLAVFTASSFACANSHSLLGLSIARVAQGFGAAGIMSVNTALVRYIFPKARLGVGMGYTSLIVAVSSAAGPTIASLILSVAHWQWLFLVNLPFYALAWLRFGKAFTLRTLLAVSLLALLSWWLPHAITLTAVAGPLAAVLGGLLCGAGILFLFRHQASLGGFNVLVLRLQDRFGWPAGKVQMALDAVVVLAGGWFTGDLHRLALSILAVVALNAALVYNHRPGRYRRA